MGTPGLMKLPPNEPLPRDKYEEKPEPTVRPGMLASIGLIAFNVCILMKNTVLEALAAKPEQKSSPVETAQKPAIVLDPVPVDAQSDAAEMPRDKDAGEAALPTAKPLKLGLGQGRVVVFQSEDSLIVSHFGPKPPSPLPFAPLPVNDNGAFFGHRSVLVTPEERAQAHAGGDAPGAQAASAQAEPSAQAKAGGLQGNADGTVKPQTGSQNSSSQGRQNRAPVVAGDITLSSLLVQQSLVIALTDLIAKIVDPDGDALVVKNLATSMGEVVQLDDTHWLYQAGESDLGNVTFTYDVTDGAATVEAHAQLMITEYPGETFEGTEDADTLIGSPGADVMDAKGGDDLVVAREGSDVIYGGSGNDRILGGEGNDVIYGGDGDDTIFGEGGDDLIHGEAGNDTVYGGDGNDYVDGGQGNDALFGGTGRDTLLGGDGDDLVYGNEGADILFGGDGADTLYGNEGDDVIQADAGNDVVDGGAGNDVMHGGAGADHLLGGDGADQIHGDEGNDVVEGGSGNDVIQGDAGADRLQGDDGNDLFRASFEDGNDVMDGGTGIDTLDLSQVDGGVVVDLLAGTSSGAATGEDILVSIENVIGSSGSDTITADEFLNVIYGGGGDDTFVFTTSASAGLGSGSRDKILDFEVGDRIDLDEISREFADQFEDALQDEGIRKFVLIRDGEAFSKPGEIRLVYEELEDGRVATIVQGNIDFDETPEFEIELYAKDSSGITYQNFQY